MSRRTEAKDELKKATSITQTTWTKKMEKDGQKNICSPTAIYRREGNLIRKEVRNLAKWCWQTQIVGILRKCCSFGVPVKGCGWALSWPSRLIDHFSSQLLLLGRYCFSFLLKQSNYGFRLVANAIHWC